MRGARLEHEPQPQRAHELVGAAAFGCEGRGLGIAEHARIAAEQDQREAAIGEVAVEVDPAEQPRTDAR